MKQSLRTVVAPHLTADAKLRWPEDAAARNQLASDMLGALIVASMNNWMALASEACNHPVATPEWRRDHGLWEQYQPFRDAIAPLPLETRRAVEALVFQTLHGTVFSILAHLDEFPYSLLELGVHDIESGATLASASEHVLALHERFAEWVERFSTTSLAPENSEESGA